VRWFPVVVGAWVFGAAPGAASAEPAKRVEWQRGWDRFTPAEGAATVGALLGTYIVDSSFPNPEHAVLDFQVPVLDPTGRELLRFRRADDQDVWARWGDIGFRTMALFPYIVDAGVVALGIHRNVDVAAQLLLIDLEAFSLAGLVHHTTSRLTGRPRPYMEECFDDGDSTRYRCGVDKREVKSFYAGHASAAFTSAGLTCLHHQNLPLWGGGGADQWACVWAVTLASFTAYTRIASDEHWLSDTMIGVGTGWLFGYFVPKWLHYGSATSRPKSLVGRLAIPGRAIGNDRDVLWAPVFAPSYDGGTVGIRAVF
jgi:membrane-associated phospholipid phosphatase